MRIKKFHIYLADLSPKYGTEPGKTRPVVVLQTDLLNNQHPSTIILPITTNIIPDSTILRVHLSAGEAGLRQDSDILIDQIRSIDNRRFIKHIGKLEEEKQLIIIENIKIIILET